MFSITELWIAVGIAFVAGTCLGLVIAHVRGNKKGKDKPKPKPKPKYIEKRKLCVKVCLKDAPNAIYSCEAGKKWKGRPFHAYLDLYKWFYLKESPHFTITYDKGSEIVLRDQITSVKFYEEIEKIKA